MTRSNSDILYNMSIFQIQYKRKDTNNDQKALTMEQENLYKLEDNFIWRHESRQRLYNRKYRKETQT